MRQAGRLAVLALLPAALLLVLDPAARADSESRPLFRERRRTPSGFHPRADWSPARAPLLGGWLGKRVMRTTANRVDRDDSTERREVATTRLRVPGWGNNQEGARRFAEVYTDPQTGELVVRTLVREKSHSREAIQFKGPDGKLGYARSQAEVPAGSTNVRELGSFWLNDKTYTEVRTLPRDSRRQGCRARAQGEPRARQGSAQVVGALLCRPIDR
jgi:hypothetical protein